MNGTSAEIAVRAPGESLLSRWAVLALLALGVLIAFIDRATIASAIAAHSFVAHFGMSSVERG